MNDNRQYRHHHHHHRQLRRCPTLNWADSLTSGARTQVATRVSRVRTIKPTRSHCISWAPLLASWLLALVLSVRGEMALAATNPTSAHTTFSGPTSISSAQSASLGARPVVDPRRHPHDHQPGSASSPPQPPATRAPAVLAESASLEAPPPLAVVRRNCSDCTQATQNSEHAQQSEWRPGATTPTPMNSMTGRQLANGLVKRDAEVEVEEPQQQSPPRKSLPQAHIAPTQHGTVTVGPRGKRPDRKKLEQLRPEDDVSKYLFKNFVPRWMDVCNRRPDRNDTIIRMYVSTWSPRSADDIDAEMLKFGTHPNVTLLHAQAGLSRRKRATNEHQQAAQHRVITRPFEGTTTPSHFHYQRQQQQQQQQQQVYSFQASQKSSILFKSGGRYDKKLWSPKKTTFKLTPMKFTQRHKQLLPSKNRFFTEQPGDTFMTATTSSPHDLESTTTTRQPQVARPSERSAKITAMTNALFHLDTQMSWQIFGSLTTIRKLRNNLVALNDTIEADKRWAQQEPEVSDLRRAEILAARQRWFPKYEDLVTTHGGAQPRPSLYNITGGLYKPGLRQLYANMTEYIQFFGVAFEQMKFDQQYFYKRDWDHDERYRLVDRQLQEILCETENYLRLEREFQVQREEYLRMTENFKLAPLTVNENQKHFFARFSNNSLHRDRPYVGQLVIESPVARAFDGLDPEAQTRILRKMDTFLPENRPPTKPLPEWLNEEDLPPAPIVKRLSRPTRLWREIMPLEQRQLYTLKERAVRDQSIIQELPPFLKSLESLLGDNYAPR